MATDMASFQTERIPGPQPGQETMTINMGPQHPSTHGVLRLVLELDGEVIVGCTPHIGYVHTGIEKTIESKRYWQGLTCTDRTDYMSPMTNNLAYILAAEKLLDCEVPERAQWIRVMLCEMSRIQSHLIWLGTHALDIGAMTAFFYGFREREQLLDLIESMVGVRLMASFFRFGGLRADMPTEDMEFEWLPKPAKWWEALGWFVDRFPDRLAEYHALLTGNEIWMERTQGVGILTPEDAIRYGCSGPVSRGSGIAWDLRKSNPYSCYDKFEFDIPTGERGDVFDRYLVRMEEMRQSARIIRQVLDGLPEGPYITDDRKVALPPREELHSSMESLIHHFLLVTHGVQPEVGQTYVSIESPKGELGTYMVSDGSNKPYRFHMRAPSFAHLQALPAMCLGQLIADVVAIIGSIDIVMGEVDR